MSDGGDTNFFTRIPVLTLSHAVNNYQRIFYRPAIAINDLMDNISNNLCHFC